MTETRRAILVPLDGSELAERALEMARRLAVATEATILLLYVVPEHADEFQNGFAPEIAEAQRYLSEVAGRVRANTTTGESAPVVLTQVCVGKPADRIISEAELWHINHIVMATHGRGGLNRVIHGSVADSVLRRSSVPVLLVPPQAVGVAQTPLFFGRAAL